jgi:hypothetical protein
MSTTITHREFRVDCVVVAERKLCEQTTEWEIGTLRLQSPFHHCPFRGLYGLHLQIQETNSPQVTRQSVWSQLSGPLLRVSLSESVLLPSESASGSADAWLTTESNSELCNECFYCRRGELLLCEHFEAHGVTMDGGFAEYCAYVCSILSVFLHSS